jgi:hypothetical protein
MNVDARTIYEAAQAVGELVRRSRFCFKRRY